jgi:DeoR family transcriptional regulator, suf operon transcriptional repressor
MKSTREKIMRTLLEFPGSTINDLAEAVGINGISIRHHLTALEADDLVTSSEERHGVGRPRLIYSLTDKGVESFPTSYLRLTHHLLNALEDKLSLPEINTLFESIGSEIAANYKIEQNNKTMDEKFQLLKTALTNEGFIIEYEKNEDSYSLTSLSCPYYQISMDHPEVCALEQTLISTLLSVPVRIETCIRENSDRCTYVIPFES